MIRPTILALSALVAVGCGAGGAAAPKKRPPPLVKVSRPERRDVTLTLTYSVDIRPIEQADLQSKVSGYVQKIYVDRGDRVTRGQLLATIRPADLPEQVTQAKEQVGQTEASYQLASENARRSRELFQRGLISKAELDNAEAQLQVAGAARGASRAGLGVVSSRLAETSIVAPFSGWVTRRFLDPGALVQPGSSSTILQVMRIDVVRVFVNVLEKDVSVLRRGLPAQVTVDALPGRSFPGQVTRFAPALDPATRTLEAEIQIPNPRIEGGDEGAYVLKPGMYGRISIAVGKHPGALVLPVEAVVVDGDDHTVFKVDHSKTPAVVHPVAVQTGFDGGDWLEITSGLAPDDEVVTAGVDLVSDGAQISIAGGGAAQAKAH